MAYVFVAGTILFTTYGQLILKHQLSRIEDMPSGVAIFPFLILEILQRPLIMSGFVAAFAASLCWMAALTRLELSQAYPFMALNFLAVVSISVPLFNESFGWGKGIGLFAIGLGVLSVAMSS